MHNRNYLLDMNRLWRDQFERAEQFLKMGIDSFMEIFKPRYLGRDVKVRRRKKTPRGKGPLMLSKEYQTPKGKLSQIVRQSKDWPYRDDIPIFSDYDVPKGRSIKHLVENMEDLEALSCLFREPSDDEIQAFHKEVENITYFAKKNDLLVTYWSLSLGDAALLLCGFEKLVVTRYRNSEFLHTLFDIIHE